MIKPPLPKEHGAWGILLGSFFSVAALTKKLSLASVLFLCAIILFYLSRHIFLPTFLQASTALRNKFQVKTIKHLGWLEVAHTLVFVVVLALAA